ncbi:MAG: hypothetical protein ABMA25_27610 [Ilumatobacteraceae bacterium]
MSNDDIEPTWQTIDLPILRAVVAAEHEGRHLGQAVRDATEHLEARLVEVHLQALIDAGYLHGNVQRAAGGVIYNIAVGRPTERGRRAVDQWPTVDGFAAELATAFDRAADAETDESRKLGYREAAKAILTGVATTAIGKYMGL